jgi:tetratricopeptide (TPR) repeat protein
MRKIYGAVGTLVLAIVGPTALGQVSMSIQSNKPQEVVVGLPFSADQSVRIVQHLANGMPLTSEVKGHVYRSATGVERYDGVIASTDPAHPDPTTMVYILDPAKHTSVLLNSKLKTATVEHLPATATVSISFLPLKAAREPGAAIRPADLVTTDLGKRAQGLITLVGKRVTGTIAAGKVGNDQPLYVTTDKWFYPQLRLLVNEVEQNPLTGERTFELTNIRGEEPDPALFAIPTDYAVKERSTLLNMPNFLAQVAPKPHEATLQELHEALDSPDANTKNSVAYALAQSDNHLPDAETLAESAVKLMEQKTADVAIRNDSNATYTQTVVLTSYWDTLGWVYYREKKLDKAEKYLLAAWDVKPNPEYALHLGSLYEAQDRPKEAAVLYRMALSAEHSPIWRDDFQLRLAKLGSTNDPLPIEVTASLPSMSSHRIPADADPLVDILIAPTGPPVVSYPNGEPSSAKSLTPAIQSALANSLPDNGPETILRRARISQSTAPGYTCELHFLTPPDKVTVGGGLVHLQQP